MSINKQPITIIELDMDYCSLTFGIGTCTAALGGSVSRKCFNTFYTCPVQQLFDKGTITYRFVQPRTSYPKTGTTFPCLLDVSGSSAQVNIAGADDQLESLGKRSQISARLVDFPYHDRFMDKYQSERISGAAQLSGVGYHPRERGTFWAKFKARNPNYAGRPMRKLDGFLTDGVLTIEKTQHYIITDIKGPDTNGQVTIEGRDVLKLADDDRAVMPAPSRGRIKSDIEAGVLTSFDLNPEGIGAEYPESGFGVIGSELVRFTRSGDTVTLTERGVSRTVTAGHRVNDTFQVSYSPRNRRVDDVLRDLLLAAGISEDFIPFADWQAEVTRWSPTLFLTTDIMKPEGVAKLIGELSILGLSIWWDDVDQEIKLQINRPVDFGDIKQLSDRNNNIEISQQDKADDRLTEVIFNTVQINPANGVNENNFLRTTYIVSALEKTPEAFGDTRIKKINCRWLNQGNDALARITSIRLLSRFRLAPVRYYVTVDYRDDLQLVSVANLESYIATDDTGDLQPNLTQVIMREDEVAGHKVKLTLQKFQFDGRYAYITENDRPVYAASSAAQKARGAYFVDETTLEFGDGTGPYVLI
jgi:hypothetical protein